MPRSNTPTRPADRPARRIRRRRPKRGATQPARKVPPGTSRGAKSGRAPSTGHGTEKRATDRAKKGPKRGGKEHSKRGPAARRSGAHGKRAAAEITSPTRLAPPQFERVEDAPPHLQACVTYRHPWVRAVLDRPPKTSVAAALQAYAEEAGVPSEEVPERTTVLTWVARFQAFGRVGLLDRVRSDAGTVRTLARLPRRADLSSREDLDAFIARVIVGLKGRPVDVVDLLRRRTARFGVEIEYSTVWRWVDDWCRRNPHLVHLARMGRGALVDHARLHLGWAGIAPGAVHSFDTSPADEWVRIPVIATAGWRDVRPYITRIIDVGSRAVLAFEVTVNSPTADSVLGVLRRAYVPGENWPGLPTVPMPRLARADTGPEHRASVEAALKRFGLSTDGPPGAPEDRAHIERLHRTLTDRVSRGQLGRTTASRVAGPEDTSEREDARGRRAYVREERRAERPLMALRTLEAFVEACRTTSVAYNATAHRGVARDIKATAERTRDARALAAQGRAA